MNSLAHRLRVSIALQAARRVEEHLSKLYETAAPLADERLDIATLGFDATGRAASARVVRLVDVDTGVPFDLPRPDDRFYLVVLDAPAGLGVFSISREARLDALFEADLHVSVGYDAEFDLVEVSR